MRTIGVTVKPDHLERIAKSRSPFPAIEELIWNALDADANTVRIRLVPNTMTGLEKVVVEDDGHGIPYADADELFSNLGGSWKRTATKSRGGRMLHGKQGEGRFLAFGLGEFVQWNTRFSDRGKTVQYTISGTRSRLGEFNVTTPNAATDAPGTTVTIENLAFGETALLSDDAPVRLAETLALYLSLYQNVRVLYDGRPVDPNEYIRRTHEETWQLPVAGRAEAVSATLTIVEWNSHQVKSLTLCDANGFPLRLMNAGIQAPGFFFTAYLRSDYLRECKEQGMLDLDELHPGLRELIGRTKQALREHFRRCAAEDAASVVAQWKADNVYPYAEEPASLVEAAERQMFDVLALNLHAYLPDFGGADDKGKRLSLTLMKQALEQNPAALQKILGEVLDLPIEKQNELAELLQRTSLSSMINAAKLIADRLDFLSFLEAIVFEKENKKTLLERSQLHRILAANTWLFAEQYALTVDDQSLTEVLRQHMQLLGRTDLVLPVAQLDGRDGIVDLMLSRRVPRNSEVEREHLVIELKRPSVKLDLTIQGQLLGYATTVADDERFRGTDTRWTFWAVSNDMDTTLRASIEGQSDRADGLVMARDVPHVRVWMKTWGQVIEASRARLMTVQKALNYNVTRDEAVGRLQTVYEKYLPSTVRRTSERAAARSTPTSASVSPTRGARAAENGRSASNRSSGSGTASTSEEPRTSKKTTKKPI